MYKISFFVVLQPNLRVYHSQSSTLRFCAISLGELWKKLQKSEADAVPVPVAKNRQIGRAHV